ncbi:hypothetical protein BYT27DRAFT_7296337, partial [Phlegmacium glaucopus]
LDFLDRLLHVDRGDASTAHFYEAVPESSKNGLLAMKPIGIMVPESDQDASKKLYG